MRHTNARTRNQPPFVQRCRGIEADVDDLLRLGDATRLIEEEAKLELNASLLAWVVDPKCEGSPEARNRRGRVEITATLPRTNQESLRDLFERLRLLAACKLQCKHVVVGNDVRVVARPGGLGRRQPVAQARVKCAPLHLGQGRVSRVADQDVVEAVAVLAGQIRPARPDQAFADENREVRTDLRLRRRERLNSTVMKEIAFDRAARQYQAL